MYQRLLPASFSAPSSLIFSFLKTGLYERTQNSMQRSSYFALLAIFSIGLAVMSLAQAPMKWEVHDPSRPVPAVVTPGENGQPPSDAVVLFDGKDASKWTGEKGAPFGWKVENGYMEVKPDTGSISTKDSFGDCQLHVEFSTPVPATGESQHRGNSGVFPMGFYEIQVLDSYQNKTYADGQASALYGQYPPLVNASRPPGQWQTYDIVFHGPRFAADGKLLRPARVTVLHNGVLTQDNVELTGPTAHRERPAYKPHPAKLPLSLQNHGNPVRYRNVWIRELVETESLKSE
jgi:hypothetical protein